ncbi:hypothetical protein YC2023_045031 [Brassica napus]
MLFDSLRNSLPKTVIYYQVREAMISLNFSTLMSIGKRWQHSPLSILNTKNEEQVCCDSSS